MCSRGKGVDGVLRVLRVLAVLAVLVVPGCSDLRVKQGIYTNLEDAKASGAVQAGWVPASLPANAADLREGHLPDGRQWGVFTFTPKDAEAVRALLGPEITAKPPACDPPGRLEWWPQLLNTPIDLERVKSTGFRLYPERGGQRAFAINWGQGRAYYWRG
jgi:hypothetical protein